MFTVPLCSVSLDSSQRPHHLCLVVYRFPPSFVPKISSHGNSKEKRPFYPTWPSTRDLIKSRCIKEGPKETIEHVSSQVGGVAQALGPGQLPRSEKQVTNMRRSEKLKGRNKGDAAADDLFVVMQRAHTEDPSVQFVRGMRTAPDPAIVLAYDFQLSDVVRFCTSSTAEFCVLTIDPTFSLGEFDVTPITYRHLLLESKRSNTHPIFLGPLLVHYRKTFATYLFFASTLVGMCRPLQGVRAFGTDGELALAEAFTHELAFSQHLTCFIHVRRNVKEKCNEFHVPTDVSQKILDDIFGARLGDTFVEGLVDASGDDDFQRKVDDVVASWQNCSVPSSANMDGFVQWFVTNKSHVIRDSMLKPIREECGLGCPPEAFTTNASESLNAMLKRKLDYKRSELPAFIDKVKELVNEQQKELERAVIGRGKYRLKQQYQYLQVTESKWFLMNQDQRKNHLSKLQSVVLKSTFEATEVVNDLCPKPQNSAASTSPVLSCPLEDGTVQISTSSELSTDVSTAATLVNIPITCLEGIWIKAKKLMETNGAIVPAPGQPPEARMVLSYSGKPPHLVTPKKSGDFSCDSSCPNWKSLGICSHSVAVAETNGQLQHFLSVKKKKAPSVTSLVTTNMPKGRGRKGGVPPRVRRSKQPVTKRIEMSLSNNSPSCTTSSTSTSTTVSFQQSATRPTLHFSPTATASQYNFLQSPFCGSNQIYQPRYPGDQDWGMGYSNFCPSPYLYMPTAPPSLPQYQPSSPFVLCFISGNISTCFGCKTKYLKSLQPPDDLCIRHQDWREFFSPNTGNMQTKYGNVYYHCKPECVWIRCSFFVPSDLQVPPETLEKLTAEHKAHLSLVFGLQL